MVIEENIDGAFFHIRKLYDELKSLRISVLALNPIIARLGVSEPQDVSLLADINDKVQKGVKASREGLKSTEELVAKTEVYKQISENLLQRVAAVEMDNRILWEAMVALHGEEGVKAIDTVRAKYLIWKILSEQEYAFNADDAALKEAAVSRVAEARERFGEEIWNKAEREYLHYKEKKEDKE